MASTASSWLALNDLSLNTLLRILCTSSINGSEPLDARFSVKYSFKSSSSSEKASSESIVKTGFVGAGAGGAGGAGGAFDSFGHCSSCTSSSESNSIKSISLSLLS